jgi:hypothetical protein
MIGRIGMFGLDSSPEMLYKASVGKHEGLHSVEYESLSMAGQCKQYMIETPFVIPHF